MSDVLNVDGLSSEELARLERQIARKYMQGISWKMIAWPFANLACFVALWPLVLLGHMPLWLAFPIATINVTLSYLPSHDAQHDTYARSGDRLRWLNEFIGHASVLLLANSYRVLKLTHIEHHKHTNNPDLDPDYAANQPSTGWGSVWNTIRSFQPSSVEALAYGKTLERLGTNETAKARRDQLLITLAFLGVLFTMAATGHALEALFLWWLPMKLASIYIRYYLSWAPHIVPNRNTSRYKNTRTFRSWLGNISSLGMTVHIVHHLHPRIPHDRTPAAAKEMMPILIARECNLEHLH